MASGIVTVAVYDVLVLPLWLLMTHRIPLPADVLGKWITRCGVIENIREQLFVLTADMQKNGLTLASLSRRSLPLSRLYSVCSLFNVGKKNFCVDIIFFHLWVCSLVPSVIRPQSGNLSEARFLWLFQLECYSSGEPYASSCPTCTFHTISSLRDLTSLFCVWVF